MRATTERRLADARDALKFSNSYTRMKALVMLAREMSKPDWLVVLGEAWSSCDNIGAYRLLLRRMLPNEGPVAAMMTADERAAYDALPQRVTIYRGCGPRNMLGGSWSISRDVAVKFPTLHRYWQAEPLLITATVPRRRVLALKLDRDESEVITFSGRRVSIERIERRKTAA